MNKILLIDDNLENLELLKIVFEQANFAVKGVANSRLIQEAVDSFQPALILMDIMLGEGNGMEICNELKNSSSTAHIKIMLMSASNIYSKEKQAKSLADAYIDKPFDIDELVEKVNQLLSW